MPATIRRIFIFLAVSLVGASVALADDPPAKKTKAKNSGRASRKTTVPAKSDDEPPPCIHMIASAKSRNTPKSTNDPFSQMMDGMMRNPAGGFAEVLKDQERAAINETRMTASEERASGRKARDDFLRRSAAKGFREVNDPARLKYLRELVANLSARMKNKARYPIIDVTLIAAPIPDAQSFPGGFLVFTTALLEEPNEATVAAVVAHELAHLDRGHLNEYARRDKMMENAFRPDPSGGMPRPDQFMTRGMAFGSVMMNPFRPEHEHEADCVATTWLYQEGYSPHALADFLERMNRRNRDQPDPPFFHIARSHPYSLDRRDAVLERLTQLQQWKTRDDLGLYKDNLARLSPKPPAR